MAKKNNVMKIVAVSIVLLFLVSGFSVMAHESGSEKSISSGDKSGNISNTNSRIAPVKYSPSNTVIANISVGLWPVAVAYDPSNGYVYVANYRSNTVSVINGATNKVIASIAVGSGPNGAAYDSSNGYLYVTNYNSNSVSVINGATNMVIASIAVGSDPVGVAYDSSNGYVYVANSNSSTVSIISTSPQVTKIYTVTFTESGLPSGTSWSVTLNNVTETSTNSTITFHEPYGTYSYSISLPSGYKTSSSTGSIQTSQPSLIIPIAVSSTAPPPSPTNYLIYIIIAVVVIAAAIGAIVAMGRRKK